MEEKINRVSNIKATAWTSIIFFSLAGYYVFSKYFIAGLIVMDSPAFALEESADVEKIVIASGGTIVFFLFAIYGAVGMLRRSQNGLAVFHATTLLMMLAVTTGLGYYLFDSEPWFLHGGVSYSGLSGLMELIALGVALLVSMWLLIRANLMLLKPSYRKEFHTKGSPAPLNAESKSNMRVRVNAREHADRQSPAVRKPLPSEISHS